MPACIWWPGDQEWCIDPSKNTTLSAHEEMIYIACILYTLFGIKINLIFLANLSSFGNTHDNNSVIQCLTEDTFEFYIWSCFIVKSDNHTSGSMWQVQTGLRRRLIYRLTVPLWLGAITGHLLSYAITHPQQWWKTHSYLLFFEWHSKCGLLFMRLQNCCNCF